MLMFGSRISHQLVHRNIFPWSTRNQEGRVKSLLSIWLFSNGTNNARSIVLVNVRFKWRLVKTLLEDNKSLCYSKMSCSLAVVHVPNELLLVLTCRYTKLSKIVQQGVFQEVDGSRQRVGLELSIYCEEVTIYQILLCPSSFVITLHTHHCKQ